MWGDLDLHIYIYIYTCWSALATQVNIFVTRDVLILSNTTVTNGWIISVRYIIKSQGHDRGLTGYINNMRQNKTCFVEHASPPPPFSKIETHGFKTPQ